jgi:hydrogenase maturation protein HypF
VISRRFHNTLIGMFTEACMAIRDESGLDRVGLSGGSFQNATLLTGLTRSLTASGFTVYSHARIPANDGSLALGQAVCAGLRHADVMGEYEKA